MMALGDQHQLPLTLPSYEKSAILNAVPTLGPQPTLLSRRQIDALYELLSAVTKGLTQLGAIYILTGGSLLGAIRQHSILFCDDDVDIAILDQSNNGIIYECIKNQLPAILGKDYHYSIRPWEGGDKVRIKSCSNVFLDLFVIRRYTNIHELMEVIGFKKNGLPQKQEYINHIVDTIYDAVHSQGEILQPIKNVYPEALINREISVNALNIPYPIWHFNTRKAIELWPKEVYRDCELFPIMHNLKMGPVVGLCGPRMPVRLLMRAFGTDCFDVYYQSMSHGGGNETDVDKRKIHSQQSDSIAINQLSDDCSDEEISSECNTLQEESNLKTPLNNVLLPIVAPGGQWSQSVKTMLSDEQYLPLQPVARRKRRHTFHCKSTLLEFLAIQSEQEKEWLIDSKILARDILSCRNISRPIAEGSKTVKTVYMDGVFDLFHIGHLHAIEQCSKLGSHLIIGVTGDEDAACYKRRPIISESDRAAIVKSIKYVDEVICPCPIVVTKEFMELWDIDLVVHGFAGPKDFERQREFFQYAIKEGKFREIEYYAALSTTDIIARVRSDYKEDTSGLVVKDKTFHKDEDTVKDFKWFGVALSAATKKSSYIPYNPFPLELRIVIEPHVQKARTKRKNALNAIRLATGADSFDSTIKVFNESNLCMEGVLHFDTARYQLRENFLTSCNLSLDFDLSRFHESNETNFKHQCMFALAKNYNHFQQAYDEFVRSVCAPLAASSQMNERIDLYYQSFPCIRIVRPGEFSIGPHADSAYGHHPCSINFYLPFTPIDGTSSLFLESKSGSEDWHPIEGVYGIVKHFAGSLCMHWTPENHCNFTRVSLDFRIIPGSMFHSLKCGASQLGGIRDVYRERDGYYSRCYCKREGSKSVWVREGPLQVPDSRCGFPWTKV